MWVEFNLVIFGCFFVCVCVHRWEVENNDETENSDKENRQHSSKASDVFKEKKRAIQKSS